MAHPEFYATLRQVARIAEVEQVVADASGQINGIAGGETGYATVVAAQADQLVRLLNSAAERNEQLMWIVIEHCFADMGRQTIALEALAAAVERWPFLRFVLVGNETVRLAEATAKVRDLVPTRERASSTITEAPRSLSRRAADKPARPAPITMTSAVDMGSPPACVPIATRDGETQTSQLTGIKRRSTCQVTG